MTDRKKTLFIFLTNTVLFTVFILFHFSGASIKIMGANPMCAFSLLIAITLFSSELTAVLTGVFVGIILDSVAMTPAGFNTVSFALISFAAALISHYLFNRNLKSAIALCFICALSYYFLRWLAVFAFSAEMTETFNYLIKTSIPSAVYTTVMIIPLFYLEKSLFKGKT